MMRESERKKDGFLHNVIAICYDFDGTLSRRTMQEDTIFREYGINPKRFWKEVNRAAKKDGYDKTLCYLNKLIYDPVFWKKPLTEARLSAMAKRIEYYPGVRKFFPYIDGFVARESKRRGVRVALEHYIISSGMKAVLDGVDFKDCFKAIYACEYEYDENGNPKCVKMAINDTNKTQFLFRINKGRLGLDQDINEHMEESDRRIPFQNIIYIGDGLSDVPCMAVTLKNGGHAVAVYPPEQNASQKCIALLQAKRVHHIARADFNKQSQLVNIIELTLSVIIQRIALDYSVYKQTVRYAARSGD